MDTVAQYAEFAGEAEAAVAGRHLRALWLLPATKLGRDGWPPTVPQRLHRRWNYWWQAHLLDCLVDAQLRDPTARRVRLIRRVARTIWLRNRLSWVNNYYDDMAWLGLALQRAAVVAALDVGRPLALLTAELRGAWTDDAGGGIRWRRDTSYKNAPANGPAAILHARVGELERAAAIAEWMTEHLVDPASGLVWDGLAVYPGTEQEPVPSKRIYSYCQGVYLGACLELSGPDGPQWQERAERTVAAVAQRLAPGGVLRGHGGGDGGLFTGILARYLALAAQRLPAGDAADTARGLVLTSAEACWANAARVHGRPLFGPEWAKPVDVPRADAKAPAQHLSVQLGAWMLLEAAAAVNVPAAPPPVAS